MSIAGARIALPSGWVARDYQQYLAPATHPIWPTWCLSPSSTPVSTADDSCPLMLSAFGAGGGDSTVDVDTEGGFVGNPEYCGHQSNPGALKDYRDTTFGGRAADYRRWVFSCDSADRPIEQYVVDSDPGFVLFSDRADAAVSAAMSTIAEESTLPAQVRPLRLSDVGIVRSAESRSDGMHVALDRIVLSTTGVINANPQTYAYVVPASVAAKLPAKTLATGATVHIVTDGNRVTSVS